jgi:hypothetical protein
MTEPTIVHLFKFYTYDRVGKDIIVDITAASKEEAWEKFRTYYGVIPVDFVLEH